MTDRVLIAVPGGFLALTMAQYAAALAEGAKLMPSTVTTVDTVTGDTKLLTAKQMEERTGKPSSWWMSQARQRRITAEKIGRSWMFDPDKVGSFTRPAVPDGEMHRL